MNTHIPEEHHAAEVGATIDAPRSGRADPLKTPATIAAKNFTYTRLPPAVRRHLRVSSRQSRQPPIDLPLETDCATQVAPLFSNLATRNRATGVDLRRSRVFQNSIRALGPKLGVSTSTHDVQAVTRRAPPTTTQLQAAHAPAAAAPQATEMDSDASPPAVEQPATSVDPAPHPEPAPPAAAQTPTATREASEATNPSSIPPQPSHQP
eukprot:jgi/Tetstr1/462416/TSEL_007422.t1